MPSYFDIRKRRRLPANLPRPEPPKTERALLVDGDPRQAESQAWLDAYNQRKEMERAEADKKDPYHLSPAARLGDAPSED